MSDVPADIHYMYNKLGCTDIEVTGRYPSGAWRKWKRFDDLLQSDETDWSVWTDRTIGDIEVVLDYDKWKMVNGEDCTPEDVSVVLDFMIHRLDRHKYKYWAYKTGGNGGHIHLFFPKLRELTPYQRKKFKEEFISMYHAEPLKASKRVMIARPTSPNRKTGKPKELIKEVKGLNWELEVK